MKRISIAVLFLVAALIVLMAPVACSSGGGEEIDADITINLNANNSLFDKGSITVPAGATVAIIFENKESIMHNFALYDSSALNTSYFIGELIGKKTVTYVFTAPSQPGTYFFRCDVHPITMTGDFIVT